MIHIRIDREVVRRADHQAVDWDLGRAETIERIIREWLATREGLKND